MVDSSAADAKYDELSELLGQWYAYAGGNKHASSQLEAEAIAASPKDAKMQKAYKDLQALGIPGDEIIRTLVGRTEAKMKKADTVLFGVGWVFVSCLAAIAFTAMLSGGREFAPRIFSLEMLAGALVAGAPYYLLFRKSSAERLPRLEKKAKEFSGI